VLRGQGGKNGIGLVLMARGKGDKNEDSGQGENRTDPFADGAGKGEACRFLRGKVLMLRGK